MKQRQYELAVFDRAKHTIHGVNGDKTICGKGLENSERFTENGKPKKRVAGELLAYSSVCLRCKAVLLASIREKPKKRPTAGRPRVTPKARYTVKVTAEVLKAAKSKHPDIHAKVVGFIKRLSEDDL